MRWFVTRICGEGWASFWKRAEAEKEELFAKYPTAHRDTEDSINGTTFYVMEGPFRRDVGYIGVKGI